MAKHILLCDDEMPILRAAEIKLTRAGYRVSCCGDGVAALETAARDKPDMIITDCQMPRMGGIELIQNVRARPELQDLPIVMLTGKEMELPIEEMRTRWHVQAVIAKPFSPRALLKMIDDTLAAETV